MSLCEKESKSYNFQPVLGSLKWRSEEFPQLHDNGITYLDNAATALYSKTQMDNVHQDLSSNLYCNPHTTGNFGKARDVNECVREMRHRILKFFNTNDEEYKVIFTSGATGACKMIADSFPWHGRKNNSTFIYLDECHTSVVGMRELSDHSKVVNEKEVYQDMFDGINTSTNLFAYPAMSNFCGKKYPYQNWLELSKNYMDNERKWYVLLDAASYVSTNPLDLEACQPDFVCISFYKIFGYPTGIGALLVKCSSMKILTKKYFGGGTVDMSLVRRNFHIPRSSSLEEYFEDGTINYLAILSLRHGFDQTTKIPGGMKSISEHTFNLAKYLNLNLMKLRYDVEGHPRLIEMYSKFDSVQNQGGICNFNILNPDGSHIGFTEFRKVAQLNNLVVRVGCFCNLGACQNALKFTDDDVLSSHEAGHVCGDDMDTLNEKPIGSIRVSFGYYSTKEDAYRVVEIIRDHYLNSYSIPTSIEIRKEQFTKAKIHSIYLYPIKSCAPMKVSRWPLDSSSLLYDRSFVIMQGRKPLTQKMLPMLCMIQPIIDLELRVMTISYPGEKDHVLNLKESDSRNIERTFKETCVGKVCGDVVEGLDCGEDVSNWLESVTGLSNLTLVQLTKREQRKSVKNYKQTQDLKSFANEAQFLMLNLNSVRELDKMLSLGEPNEDNGKRVTSKIEWITEQFRGNIVISGNLASFEEEHWRCIRVKNEHIGCAVRFNIQNLCKRCSVLSVDQKNGELTQEPLKTLSKMEGRKFSFGVLASLEYDKDFDLNNSYISTQWQLEISCHK